MERRRFDHELKDGAVRIVRETGKPVAQVARELGVNEGTLGRWVNQDRRHREDDGALTESEREELNRLRRENAELAMELMSSNAWRPCGCYPDLGITPTMPSTGLCRGRR